ncbi:MAG: hypothetical protein BECKG1743D_GA0114223_101272 [Candidatus Kentron sp. G]|nr:MAG: hypothetical protein BECKG1743F_GA0114225_100773 [Candidatus Kentron sp. G]VFM96957.1 MAG: hypothetical protein BECKG1743E_GA0114224_101013 [Candidatus Kentron sp. G]VFM99495.1 MAG: hypothetical protein BECKG1743D_GA0114223_101272 [Candidatus Kentron sp. G]
MSLYFLRNQYPVQLADMVVGAIARSYRVGDRVRHNRWRLALQPKIEDVWEFR